jgi:hypothetical protein
MGTYQWGTYAFQDSQYQKTVTQLKLSQNTNGNLLVHSTTKKKVLLCMMYQGIFPHYFGSAFFF